MTKIDDGMTVMLQHERVQVRLKMLRRYNIHLWTIVSSLEDGRYNTFLMRIVLTKDGLAKCYSRMESTHIYLWIR